MSFDSFPSDWTRARNAEREIEYWKNQYYQVMHELTQVKKELETLKKERKARKG